MTLASPVRAFVVPVAPNCDVFCHNNRSQRQPIYTWWNKNQYDKSLMRRFAEPSQKNKDASSSKKSPKQKGVYVRPSAAIERGSGFFVPGLEGPKVRLVFGSVLLILASINHWQSTSESAATPGNAFSETLAIVYSLLVLFQAAIEYVKETKQLKESEQVVIGNDNTVDTSLPIKKTIQQWYPSSLSNSQAIDSMEEKDLEVWKNRVEWAALLYLSLTKATDMLLVGRTGILYRVGSRQVPSSSSPTTPESSTITKGAQAAHATLAQSISGRVALPLTHQAVTNLLLLESTNDIDSNVRSVVLQRIVSSSDTDDSDESQQEPLCWMMASNELLPAFTDRDLEWLGQLARYIHPMRI